MTFEGPHSGRHLTVSAGIHPRIREPLLVMPAILLGLLVRAIPVAGSEFPLHDGGLFLVMAQDLIANDFVLPHFTTYNLDEIPFAYPPFAIYLLAWLMSFGLDGIALLRLLPVLFSLATVPLVYLIARELTGSWRVAAVAGLAFALVPRSYEWLVIGGGAVRGLGLMLSLAAIWQVIRLLRSVTLGRMFLAGAFLGGVVLTHPEAALFTVVSIGALALARARARGQWLAVIGVALFAALLASPWILTVVTLHGPDVLSGAAGSRTALFASSMRMLLFGHFTGATAMDIFLGIGLVGLLVELSKRQFLIPFWVLLTMSTVVAAGATFAMVPWSILVALAVVEVLFPAVERLSGTAPRFARSVLETGLLGAAVIASLATGYSQQTPMHPLAPAEPAAMEWARMNLPPDARVVIITGLPWSNDATSEWFPAMAGRQSVATVQGYEWSGTFASRHVRHQQLQTICAPRTVECLRRWMEVFAVDADYVYIPKGQLAGIASAADCCPAFRDSAREQLVVVFDGDGATIASLEEP